MQRIISLALLVVSTMAFGKITPDPKTGDVKCTAEPGAPCQWKIGGGQLWLCQGSICLQIVKKPADDDQK